MKYLKYTILLILVAGCFVAYGQSPVTRAIKEGNTTKYYMADGDSATTTIATEVKPYASLVVTLSQDSSEVPRMRILEHGFSVTPTITKEGVGHYEIVVPNGFPDSSKVWVSHTCGYGETGYDDTRAYASLPFFNNDGSLAGQLIILPGDPDYITIIVIDAAGNPAELSEFIVIDDISGTYSMPEIRRY